MATGIVSCVMLGLAGCNPDVTEQFFSVRIKNDLPVTITVQQCTDSTCSHVSDRFVLDPGESFSATTSSKHVANPYRFVRKGRTIGCFPLLFSRRASGVVLLVSRSGPC